MSPAGSAGILGLACVVLFTGCANAPSMREKQTDELRTLVNRVHDRARVDTDAPLIVDEIKNARFMWNFGRENCGFDPSTSESSPEQRDRCDALFKKNMIERLGARYFAADQKEVSRLCSEHPLACGDAKVLELWMRESHNAQIERSRAEKLPKVELWRAGRITNDGLQAALNVPQAGE